MDKKEIKNLIKTEIVPYLIGLRNEIADKPKDFLGENEIKGVIFKGEKGDEGAPGYTPVADKDYHSKKTIEAFIINRLPKKGKEYFTRQDIREIVAEVKSYIPTKEELKGKDGVIDYSTVKTLADGMIEKRHKEIKAEIKTLTKEIYEKIASSGPKELTAQQIVQKLESLTGSQRLDAKAIKGLENFIQTVVIAGGGSPSGGGATSSGGTITSSDGSLTIAGSDAIINLAHGNIWSATQTFTLAPVFSAMTAGSVFFAGTAGILSQDNTNFFWNNSSKRLNIGVTLGSELMANAGFTGTSSWTNLTSSGWANTGGTVAEHSSNGTTPLTQGKTFQIGRVYEFTYTIPVMTVGTVTPSMGGVTLTARTSADTYTQRFVATSASGDVTFTPSNTSRFTLDNTSLKQVSGVVLGNDFALLPPTLFVVTNSSQNLTTGTPSMRIISTGNAITIPFSTSGSLVAGIVVASSGEMQMHGTGGDYFALYSGVAASPTKYMTASPSILGHTGAVSAGAINAPSNLTANKSFGRASTLISTNTTLDDTHAIVFIDADGGNVDVTLPAITAGLLREYKLKKVDAGILNTITIYPDGSNTIEGAGSYDLSVAAAGVTLVPLATVSSCHDFDATDEGTCEANSGCDWDDDVTCNGDYVSAGVWYATDKF